MGNSFFQKVILLTCILFCTSIQTAFANNTGSARKVWIDNVPGLAQYLEENFSGATLSRETLDIQLIDLNKTPDGVEEILLGVKDFSFFCGNRGCDYHVLKREASGKLVRLFGMIAFELVPAPGFSKGYRNLANSSFDDAVVLKFDGTTYQVSSQTVTELRNQSNNATKTSTFPVIFEGKCGNRGT